MRLKTFKIGGVHPPENKITAHKAIESFPVPTLARVMLHQNLGVASVATVGKGDEVKVGQVIARQEGFISSSIHSPVSGIVTKIEECVDASGYRKPAIFIETKGDEWLEGIDTTSALVTEIKASKEEIIKKVTEMGIVGLGGATFPSQVKLMVPEGNKAEYIIINGVECEPYLTSDHRLMLERPHEIMIGVQLLMKASGASKALIGIEANKPDAIDLLTKVAQEYTNIEVYGLKVKYPQGGEKQLIKALTGREVPSGKLPISVGCIVNNVGTAFAVYEAVQKNKPLVERVVTITGKGLKEPGNFMVRIGTSIADLLAHCGYNAEHEAKIVSGGPMMGKAVTTPDIPMVKGTSGILVIEEGVERVAIEPCIRCGRCTRVCPMGLEPYLLAMASSKKMYDITEANAVMDCIECGSCHYICPAGRPLLDYVRLGKSETGKIMRSRKSVQ
ncbi:MAG: electron transport complex subunit RsxC [Sphingobacteriia bacterium]|nr:electron transport complex subunit RsxC [Sphingobacteriia bacterium]